MSKIILKTGWREALLIILPLCVFITFIIFLIYFTAPIKNAGLQKAVSTVLQSKYPNVYSVSAVVPSNTTLAVSAVAFELTSRNAQKKYSQAIIIRITGISGPLSAVFLYAPLQPLEFAGIAGITDPQDNPIKYGITPALINFWSAKLYALVSEVENEK